MKTDHFEKVCRSRIPVHNILDDDVTASDSEESENDNHTTETKTVLRTHTINNDQIHRVSDTHKMASTMTTIKLNGTAVNIQIDSGSEANILSENDFLKLKIKPELRKSNHRLYPFASQHPLPILGMFVGTIKTPLKFELVTFHVVPSKIKVGNTVHDRLSAAIRISAALLINVF